MKNEIVENREAKYLKVELLSIKQKDKVFFLSKIDAVDFIKMYTVQPAQYDYIKHSQLANSFPDEQDYYNHLINIDLKNIENKNFQREANSERVKSIKNFLETEEFAFFPNTIIANCDLINTRDEYYISQNNTFEEFAETPHPPFLSFLQEKDNKFFLYIPYINNSILVIDGQHRVEGLKNASKEVIENFELVICFIIGYDRSVIAKQFYTINYEQKSVNKSLLIQLTGEFSKGIGEISYLHTLVKVLNELEDSPFFNRIKMLGVTPKYMSSDGRKMLTISQAFLVDNLMRFISEAARNTLYPPIFLKFYKNENERIEIIKAIARFFKAVEKLVPEWNNPMNSIVSKGMGVGALIKVYNLLFPIIFKDYSMDWHLMKTLKVNDYVKYLAGLENVDFRTNGPYGGVGSGGTINKLKEEIILKNIYLGPFESFSQFEAKYRQVLLNFSAHITNLY